MKRRVLIVISLLFVFSCKTTIESSKMKKVESLLIAKGDLYGAGAEGIAEQNMIIDNETDWNDLMTKMNSVNKVSDSFKETVIDFSEFNVIAAFDQIRGNGGYSLELHMNSNSKNCIVNVTRLYPQGNATTVMTQPFYLVKIAKRELPIVFK
jgi:hypothetical protein